jgi:hypothetical protein
MLRWLKTKLRIIATLRGRFHFAPPTTLGNHALSKTHPHAISTVFGLISSMEPGIVLVNLPKGTHENERRSQMLMLRKPSYLR